VQIQNLTTSAKPVPPLSNQISQANMPVSSSQSASGPPNVVNLVPNAVTMSTSSAHQTSATFAGG
jgi:hypothetical protein